jgi:hypothetical protein
VQDEEDQLLQRAQAMSLEDYSPEDLHAIGDVIEYG